MNLEAYLNSFIKEIDGYYFEVGVISDKSVRDKNSEGVTNAELMFIHENGSPLRNIPSRPVLQMTVEYALRDLLDKEYSKAVDIYLDTGFNLQRFEQSLKRSAIKIENYAREIIYSNDGRLAPNAYSTRQAKAKKYHISVEEANHPLFDTGQLARSITCRVCKNGEQI